MRRTPAWRRYLRFWRPDIEGDVDDELRVRARRTTRIDRVEARRDD